MAYNRNAAAAPTAQEWLLLLLLLYGGTFKSTAVISVALPSQTPRRQLFALVHSFGAFLLLTEIKAELLEYYYYCQRGKFEKP